MGIDYLDPLTYYIYLSYGLTTFIYIYKQTNTLTTYYRLFNEKNVVC